MRKIIFGIRKSRLAAVQLDEFLAYLANNKIKLDYSIKTIMTKADKDKVTPLQKIGIGGFTKEIERALLAKDIDCAVHSLKDMPVDIEPGTMLSCFTARQDPRDCLIARDSIQTNSLRGLRIGTGSPRRDAFLKELGYGLEVLPLRGNVDTRICKMDNGYYDALVLAACGLKRLGYTNRIRAFFDPEKFVPAAGQGIICSQTRDDDAPLNEILKACSCPNTETTALAERKVLKTLGIGCQKPFGVYGYFDKDKFTITAKAYIETTNTYIYEQRKSSRIYPEKATDELICSMKRSNSY